MTLVEEIKARMKAAMKAKDDVAKDVLRVALGEIQLAESRTGGSLDEEAGHKIVKKLVASNEATLDVSSDPATRARLEAENQVLLDLVPRSLTVEEIATALAPISDKIRAAKADGPAIGMALKHLRASGAAVEGEDVRAAVAQLRSGA